VSWPAGGKLVAKREAPPAPPADPAAAPDKPKPPPGPDKWSLVEGQAAVGGNLDETVPSSLASTLARLDAVDFVEGDLGPPRATLAAVLKDGTRKELVIGKEVGQDVWVKRPDSPRLWTIRKASADNLVKGAAQWRDKTLSKLDATTVQRIEVTSAQHGRLVFERVDEKTWKGLEPAELAELDSSKAQGLAAGFANLRAVAVIEAPDPKKTGLAKPTGTITVKTKDGKSVTLTAGALADKNYYVKVSGRDEVFSLGEYVVGRYFKPAAEFKKQPKPPAAAGMPPGHPPM
jgi:hypothetical protein